jgi:hypothetical protein
MMGQKLRHVLPALIVLVSLLPFSWTAWRNSDLPQFGRYQDDGLYVIGAKSLHDGQGYRISNLPGAPFQTKYLPLYSALLSVLWPARGGFPGNLPVFAGAQWVIAVAFFLLSFGLFRALGFSDLKSAWMLAFLALNPWLAFWSLLPTSDALFSALVVATFLSLHRFRENPRWWWLGGLTAAAACLTKSAGILVVPALLAGGWRRQDWKRTATMTLPAVIAFAGWSGWSALHRIQAKHPVMLYYTDYVGFHIKMGGIPALPDIIQTNLPALIGAVGNSVLYDLAESTLGRFLSVIVLAAAIAGIIRITRRNAAIEYPIFCGLLTLVLLMWNFTPNARLMNPLLPLLTMGAFVEAEHVWSLIRASLRSPKFSNRAAAGLMLAGISGAVICSLILNTRFIVSQIPRLIQQEREVARRERAVFEWCKRNLAADSAVLAFNDSLLYLSTGLKGVRPVPNSVAFYRGDRTDEISNFTQIDKLIESFGITHVIVTPDDFGEYDSDQERLILAALKSNPGLRTIYSADGSLVLETLPGGLSASGAAAGTATNSSRSR